MPYQTKITEEREYLRVEVTGDRTQGKEAEDAISTLSQIADICHKKGLSRILMSSNLSRLLPTMAAFDVAKTPEAFGWSRSFKLAVVNLSRESKEELLFAETVAVNRGYRLFKIFNDEEEAKEWLLES